MEEYIVEAAGGGVGLALWTKTLKTSYIFWGEMVLFLSGYTAILISA